MDLPFVDTELETRPVAVDVEVAVPEVRAVGELQPGPHDSPGQTHQPLDEWRDQQFNPDSTLDHMEVDEAPHMPTPQTNPYLVEYSGLRSKFELPRCPACVKCLGARPRASGEARALPWMKGLLPMKDARGQLTRGRHVRTWRDSFDPDNPMPSRINPFEPRPHQPQDPRG